MAFICTKPKGSCRNCEHYRYDEDYGGKACFAKQAAENAHECPLGGDIENDYRYESASGECVRREDRL